MERLNYGTRQHSEVGFFLFQWTFEEVLETLGEDQEHTSHDLFRCGLIKRNSNSWTSLGSELNWDKRTNNESHCLSSMTLSLH